MVRDAYTFILKGVNNFRIFMVVAFDYTQFRNGKRLLGIIHAFEQ